MNITLAIDGPAGSGKSTIAKLLAKEWGITYLDTGAMYRAVTLYLLENNISVEDAAQLEEALQSLELDQIDNHIYLNGKEVTEAIRSKAVTGNVSVVASCPAVRKALVRQQQAIAAGKSIVMDGRDIGTVVLPDATMKVFLTASPEVRGKRRWTELTEKGVSCQLEEIVADIIRRDEIDSNREHSPLKQASDAVRIDSSHMEIAAVVEAISAMLKGKIKR